MLKADCWESQTFQCWVLTFKLDINQWLSCIKSTTKIKLYINLDSIENWLNSILIARPSGAPCGPSLGHMCHAEALAESKMGHRLKPRHGPQPIGPTHLTEFFGLLPTGSLCFLFSVSWSETSPSFFCEILLSIFLSQFCDILPLALLFAPQFSHFYSKWPNI